jgi:hypothetical protein
MNDVAEPSADHPASDDVNAGALRRPAPPPEVDPSALRRSEPAPDVDVEALTRTYDVVLPGDRRRLVLRSLAAVVVLALAGGGFWWRHEVTSAAGLEFHGGPNVYRDVAATDRTGIGNREGVDGSETEVAFQPDSRLYLHVGLYNGGRHDVRIEGVRPASSYSWGFERMAVAKTPDGGAVTFADRYEPFRPFTLKRYETRDIRLEFRLADCDPASVQPGGLSVLRSLDLRYRTLRISRTTDVSFRDAVVALQAVRDCAHPID